MRADTLQSLIHPAGDANGEDAEREQWMSSTVRATGGQMK